MNVGYQELINVMLW